MPQHQRKPTSFTFVPCFLLATGSLLARAGFVVALEPFESAGHVEAVTVYRGQALVTRVVEFADLGDGPQEVVVTDLPANVLPGSVHAESGEGVEVRSVRFRARPVGEAVHEEVRAIDERIRALENEMAHVQRRKRVLDEHRQYLQSLQNFVAPTASTELTHGVLDADTLQQMTRFLFEERQRLAQEELQLEKAERGLNEQIDLERRQREQVAAGFNRTAHEAVLFLNADGPGEVRLNYLVSNATWSPSYTARAATGQDGITLEYYASIQQMSGEDWSNVAMTLSTATPSLNAQPPRLDALVVGLTGGVDPALLQADAYFATREQLKQQQRDVDRSRNVVAQTAAPAEGGQVAFVQAEDAMLNRLSSEMQVLDLNVNIKDLAKARSERDKGIASPEESLSITYRLPDRTSLPSRADRQLVRIASLPLDGEFHNLALPVLTNYVYREALTVNDGPDVLLAGPVSTYVDGQFVGHGDIPNVAVGERFTLGFGVDSSLRAARELVERTETIQGGNRVVEFTYRLTVENFGGEATGVRLIDRLPTVEGSEIRITLLEGEEGLSEDVAYRQGDYKKGLLRWDVSVPAQAVGTEAFTLEYTFRMEYDKQMSVTALPHGD